MPVTHDPSRLAPIMAPVANRTRVRPAKKSGQVEPESAKRIGRPSSLSRNDPDVTRMVNDRLAGGAHH